MMSGDRSSPDGPPVEENDGPVGDSAQLVQVAGDDDHDRTLVREIPDHPVHVGPGMHVNPASGVVQ